MFAIGLSLESYADTQATLQFRTIVPQSASVRKESLRSGVTADPETGIISGTLSSIFELDTNGDDDSYDFIITSSIESTAGVVSAYDQSGNILFANTEAMPTDGDVTQALSHTGANNNVIAYPVTITTDTPFTSSYQQGYKTYGDCYVIKVNGGSHGFITHQIESTPVSGTFSKTRDTSGSYRAVVTFTVAGI